MPTLGPSGQTLNYDQLKALWVANGGNPASAPIMASIALVESGGLSNNLNNTGKDYSVGLWQINYYGPLLSGRSASYGSPLSLAGDVNAQARAAIAISGNGRNLTPWTTYTSGDAGRMLAGKEKGGLPTIAALPSSAPAPVSDADRVASNEGLLIDITVPISGSHITLGRASVRRIVGGMIMVGGAVLGLAGTVILVGGKASLPGPAGVVSTALRQRGQTQRTKATQEGLSGRQADRSARSGRPAGDVRDIRSAKSYRDARAQGEADAVTAGEFA